MQESRELRVERTSRAIARAVPPGADDDVPPVGIHHRRPLLRSHQAAGSFGFL